MSQPPRPPERIAKLLARAGVASRREIERMIEEGRIALNGETLTTPATLLKSLAGVTVDGNPVAAPAPARLFAFHKTAGLLTAERDFTGRRTIYDALPADLPRVVPVGRLDLNTEGLLLLTTDGGLKRQLELPSSGVERSYRARAYGEISQAQLEELIEGIEIDGIRYGQIDANLERRTGANVWIEMTLTEGKNREVRRVLEHLGLRVSRLIRTRYGPFLLGDLPPGEVVEIRQHDLVAFRKALALPPERRKLEPAAEIVPAVNRAARRAEAAQARETAEPDAPRRRVAPAAAPKLKTRTGPRRAGDARPSRPPVKAEPERPRRARTEAGDADSGGPKRMGDHPRRARPDVTDPAATPARGRPDATARAGKPTVAADRPRRTRPDAIDASTTHARSQRGLADLTGRSAPTGDRPRAARPVAATRPRAQPGAAEAETRPRRARPNAGDRYRTDLEDRPRRSEPGAADTEARPRRAGPVAPSARPSRAAGPREQRPRPGDLVDRPRSERGAPGGKPWPPRTPDGPAPRGGAGRPRRPGPARPR